MSTQTPDELFYTKLLTLFSANVIGPVINYHAPAGEDLDTTYVTYRRTSTEYQRDLQGNVSMELVSYDVEVSSMFFNNAAVDMSTLDNWTSSGWYFNLDNQQVSEDQFSITFSLTACKAF